MKVQEYFSYVFLWLNITVLIIGGKRVIHFVARYPFNITIQ